MRLVNAPTTDVEARVRKVARIVTIALALQSFSLTTIAQVRPSVETTDRFINALMASTSNVTHGFAEFARHPTREERKTLRSAGIHVLDHFQGTTYRVRVEKRVSMSGVKATKLDTHLLQIRPQDRVEPTISRGQYERYVVTPPGQPPVNYVLNADGTLNVTVRFYREVNQSTIGSVLRKYARKVAKQTDETWVAVITTSSLQNLAKEDVVQWIDAGPPPFLPDNATIRATINVDAVQNFNAATGQVQGLGGNGIQVGIFDSGVDQTHNDLTPGMIFSGAAIASHGTHVAGIVGGRGTLSNGNDSWGTNNNGAAFQWRGMAPQAELIETGGGANGENAATYLGFTANQGMDVSNHSYSFSFDGDYSNGNQTRDQIIRGNATSNGTGVPGRLQVYSAGNHGASPFLGGEQVGYFALTKQVKNGLLVGNWDAANNRIARSSSLGPAYDGRIKPDVVAPGTSVTSSGYCANGENSPSCQNGAGQFVQRQDFYRVMNGTSAPAVTGSIALVLQQYATTYNANIDRQPPEPSTIRGVMVHTANDVGAPNVWFNNPDGAVQPAVGPDFVTGWGLIDAQAAASIVSNRLLLEDTISNTCGNCPTHC